jgi:hypothetical protein
MGFSQPHLCDSPRVPSASRHVARGAAEPPLRGQCSFVDLLPLCMCPMERVKCVCVCVYLCSDYGEASGSPTWRAPRSA